MSELSEVVVPEFQLHNDGNDKMMVHTQYANPPSRLDFEASTWSLEVSPPEKPFQYTKFDSINPLVPRAVLLPFVQLLSHSNFAFLWLVGGFIAGNAFVCEYLAKFHLDPSAGAPFW
ncbi:hypothetical protein N7475_001068 [Penicillium sp. IBT 31633x]|nr:hypothetical protein N7475_001068 [Penicillium sp. IBT 31633x]